MIEKFFDRIRKRQKLREEKEWRDRAEHNPNTVWCGIHNCPPKECFEIHYPNNNRP